MVTIVALISFLSFWHHRPWCYIKNISQFYLGIFLDGLRINTKNFIKDIWYPIPVVYVYSWQPFIILIIIYKLLLNKEDLFKKQIIAQGFRELLSYISVLLFYYKW